MKRLNLFAFLFLSITSAANAQNTDDICTWLAGKWVGSYSFKSMEDCREFGKGSCTHNVKATVEKMGTSYSYYVTADQVTGTFTCKNGKITPTADVGGFINTTLTCEAPDHCILDADTPIITGRFFLEEMATA